MSQGNTKYAASAYETIAMLPQTLMWGTSGAEFRCVELAFAERISEALGGLLPRLRAEAPSIGERLSASLTQAPSETVTRVLLSPNISQQLLWTNNKPEDIGQFLEHSLLMESVEDGALSNWQPGWGPLGDRFVSQKGTPTRWSPIEGRLPIDLESPDVVALGSSPPAVTQGWEPLAPADRAAVLKSLRAAYVQVRGNGASLESLMDVCARVVVIRQKGTGEFCSFSSCNFVGRIALVNPQLVGELVLAEALVHEAIHAYLYMQEPNPLWGLLPFVGEDPGTVASPWTGREIAACAFLHACFVWYGLFFFWMRELRRQLATPAAVHHRIVRAASGFMKGPLLDCLPGRGAMVRDEVKLVLAALQANVLSLTA